MNKKKQRAGQLGGIQTFIKHSDKLIMNAKGKMVSEYMWRQGKLGGRPRLPTLAEVQSQQNALREKELIDRRNRLPAGNSMKALRERLKYKEQAASYELAACSGGGNKK
jgi:hypothetical protein